MSKQVPIIPQHQTIDSAGADLICNVAIEIRPGEVKLVKTGSYVPSNLKDGQYLALHARSSLALKRKLMLANGVGVIDKDFEDEIQVMLYNCGCETQYLFKGERIAQVVPANYIKGIFPIKSNRRTGGFGSSDEG